MELDIQVKNVSDLLLEKMAAAAEDEILDVILEVRIRNHAKGTAESVLSLFDKAATRLTLVIEKTEGTVVMRLPKKNSVYARVPKRAIETLATHSDVIFVDVLRKRIVLP